MGTRKADPIERRQFVVRLLCQAIPETGVVRRLVAGITDPVTGKTWKVSRSTAFKDLKAVGLQYRSLWDDPLVVERFFGAADEQLGEIYRAAMAAGKLDTAIRAVRARAVFYGIRSSGRWPMGSQAPDEVRAPVTETERYRGLARRLENATDEELAAELAGAHAEAERLGLRVVPGGRS